MTWDQPSAEQIGAIVARSRISRKIIAEGVMVAKPQKKTVDRSSDQYRRSRAAAAAKHRARTDRQNIARIELIAPVIRSLPDPTQAQIYHAREFPFSFTVLTRVLKIMVKRGIVSAKKAPKSRATGRRARKYMLI